MPNTLKVCLLAAGKGSRNSIYKNLHKAFLPIGNKPVIDLILKNIPTDTEIIVPCGHLKEQLKSVLSLYPYKWTFVDVDYVGDGTGPGLSLLSCKEHLQQPFIFITVDTIFDFQLETPTQNWALFTNRPNSNKFCNPNFEFDTYSEHIFAGICGIYNFKKFFEVLQNADYIENQKEVINTIPHMSPQILYSTCFDTGNNESYLNTLQHFNNIELKNEECTFILNNKVIKFYEDNYKVDKYIIKYNEYPFTPQASKLNHNMLIYNYIDGTLLSNINNISILESCISQIFTTQIAGEIEQENINYMYKEKTLSRIKYAPNIDMINGYKVYQIDEIIKKINWNIFDDYIPCIFHGDLQPENIIISDKIYFIDPRISFGHNTHIGDLYYELGKLYHAIFVNGDIVRNKQYITNSDEIQFNIKSNLLSLKNILKKACLDRNINWDKVVLIGILQYLNIYSLYKNRYYSDFLYKLGILKISQYINGDLDEIFS